MEKTLILVVGCGRSGTSAVAGSLAAAGIHFGDDLLTGGSDNPKGHFESKRVIKLHERILKAMGKSWHKVGGNWPDDPEWALGEVVAFIHSLPDTICAVKDPRASIFVHLWETACEAEGVRLCVLDVQRRMKDTIASLVARERWTNDRARELVKLYDESIATSCRFRQSAIWASIWFPDDLTESDQWARVFDTFGIDVDLNALCSFFDPALVHHDGGESYARAS